MTRLGWAVAALVLGGIVFVSLPGAAAQTAGEVSILHTPPTEATPGQQVYLEAVLRNATVGVVAWNNGSLAADAVAPMTNLTQNQDGGWLYAAWLPAQVDGTQVTYSIQATGPAGAASESYFLVVALPSASGISPQQQHGWILTIAASLAMTSCVIVLAYWFVGRRIKREDA